MSSHRSNIELNMSTLYFDPHAIHFHFEPLLMSKISLLNILALTAKDAILINPRFLSFVIVALNAINSAKENGHDGQVCHVWSFFACFYCLDCHGCHEIKSYLPLMPFLPRKKISWHPRPHWLPWLGHGCLRFGQELFVRAPNNVIDNKKSYH